MQTRFGKSAVGLHKLSSDEPRRLRDDHNRVTRNRNAFPTTLTEDNAMAAAAMIGESRIPKLG